MYMPEAAVWSKVRSHIAKHYKRLSKISHDKKFIQTFKTILGEQLKTAPKGYPKDHPALEYLKYKYMYINHPVSDKEVTSRGFMDTIIACYKTQRLFQDFLNEGVAE
jgi:uncharacterized protein (TIGR02453 family)